MRATDDVVKSLKDVKETFSVADPGFSRGGGVNPPGGGVNTPNFPENCMKSKEFGRPGGGACVPHAPLDPPMVLDSRNQQIQKWYVTSNPACKKKPSKIIFSNIKLYYFIAFVIY